MHFNRTNKYNCTCDFPRKPIKRRLTVNCENFSVFILLFQRQNPDNCKRQKSEILKAVSSEGQGNGPYFFRTDLFL